MGSRNAGVVRKRIFLVFNFQIAVTTAAVDVDFLHLCTPSGLKVISCVSKFLRLVPPGTPSRLEHGVNTTCIRTGSNSVRKVEKGEVECPKRGTRLIAYLIDRSGSLSGCPGCLQKTFNELHAELRHRLPDGRRVSVYIYSSNVLQHFTNRRLTSPRRRSINLSVPTPSGGTATGEALLTVGSKLQPGSAIIHVTDGKPDSKTKVVDAVRQLSARNIRVISIGVGKGIDTQALLNLGSTVITIDSYDQIGAALRNAYKSQCADEYPKNKQQKCIRWAIDDDPMSLSRFNSLLRFAVAYSFSCRILTKFSVNFYLVKQLTVSWKINRDV